MKIIAIKTKSGIYISAKTSRGIEDMCFDGKLPERTFKQGWFKIKKVPKKIQKEVSQDDINYRYEIKDESLINKKIKKVLKRKDVAYYEDYGWIWKDEYEQLESLYELKSDKQPNIMEDVEFEIDIVIELDEIKEASLFSYTVQRTKWKSDGTTEITNRDVKHQIIDEIVFPDILLTMKPCSLTSEESYKIVRQHVKDNIDPKMAEITSNYDFCFTVKKKIPFSEPEKYTVDVNNNMFSKRKRKPKYETRFRIDRLVEIFEMTHAGTNYKGYTTIKGFVGQDHTDLKEKIDLYLESLMEFINKPIKDCPDCNGNGVILQKVIPEYLPLKR